MALTIQEIQDFITNNGDIRQAVNMLADYAQANPGGSPGGSSYLVYTALISQASALVDPTLSVLENTLSGSPVWARIFTGIYKATLTGQFTIGKTIAPPFAPFTGDATVYLPILSGPAIVGYYNISDGGDGNTVNLYVVDDSFAAADLFTIMGNGGVLLVNIEVYS